MESNAWERSGLAKRLDAALHARPVAPAMPPSRLRLWLSAVWRGFELPSADPELAASQLAALARQLPLLYVILLINGFSLVATHLHTAPDLLIFFMPAVLLLVSVARLIFWLRSFRLKLAPLQTLRRLRMIILMTVPLGAAFTMWSLSLFPYGNAYERSQVVFCMGLTAVNCIFCVMHVRAAALMLTVVVMLPFSLFFLATGNPVLIAMTLNMLSVTAGMVFMLLRNSRDFDALIRSRRELINRQRETQRLSDENLRLANLDSLSGLPNRRRFFQKLEETMLLAERAGRPFAVALLDLDRFKTVNDIYGHAAGDRLLVQVGLRFKQISRDELFIARLGGDEFGAILMDGEIANAVEHFGAQVRSLLEGPCVVGDRLAAIACSIGVALYPQAGTTAAELFERADYALYHGKQNRKGAMIVFSDEHETVIRSMARMEQAFRSADMETEFWVAFQPIVDLENNSVLAFEALARWANPELGPIGPDVFIAVAERAQMTGQLTTTLLRKALAAARLWPPEIGLCFNLSAQDLMSAETMAALHGVVQASGVAPARIEFEVTETALMQDFDQAAAALDALHGIGARVSLDDFGTGFSSLGYVNRLPLDKIKIDRSFVTDIERSRTAPGIIRAITGLCDTLELACVVEGVETAAQLSVLRGLGCRYIQGYLISRPVPEDAIAQLIGRIAEARPGVEPARRANDSAKISPERIFLS
jgi:diguanylate cyclase (GGDEF)-like protein